MNIYIATILLSFTYLICPAQDADKIVHDFLTAKGPKGKSNNYKPVPDVDIERFFALIPDAAAPPKDKTKKIKRMYEVIIRARYTSKEVIDYDTSGRWTQQTMWGTSEDKSIDYYNSSTGKSMAVNYAKFASQLTIDTMDIGRNATPVEEPAIRRITISYTDSGSWIPMKKKLYPMEEAAVNYPFSKRMTYNREGYVDSAITIRGGMDTAVTTFAYDKNHRVSSAYTAHANSFQVLAKEKVSNAWEYDKSGKLLSKSYTVVGIKIGKHSIDTGSQTTKATYTYDNKGRLIRYTYYGLSEHAFPDSCVTSFTYSVPGVVEMTIRSRDNNTTTIETYNQYGYVQRRECRYPQYPSIGMMNDVTKMQYEYY